MHISLLPVVPAPWVGSVIGLAQVIISWLILAEKNGAQNVTGKEERRDDIASN